ncbi:hypothetical protein JR316_0011367 [Psilocybe cubensis]|uniref:Uncharacterized protein n=2 Tax=Psilocybe cubensis TaxID=181762 RepID=A0ACB8GK85_PSICU|nr:hypothetical protein JR316_0011367 [Psilocybe cubensis]KAH9475807.1 hypothetical protein JR316_0011367 [Psilocybe cubensis]
MADPLSLTLAAITLATALKDIIELAQKIEESFTKTSHNLRQLHALSTEISATLRELKEFCDEHYTVLSDAKDMKTALLELKIAMKSVYTRCCEMVPPKPATKIGKFKVAFSGWKNRDKMESEIVELRNHVNKCHSRFMMFTVMRIEKRIVEMGRRRSSSLLVRRVEMPANSGVSDASLVTFVGTSERTFSTLPPEITADFISDTYLRLQINAIDGYLQELSSKNTYTVEEPLDDYLKPYKPVLHVGPSSDKNIFRQDIIAQSLEIQSCLRSDSSTLSIQEGAWSMVNLSIGLHSLEMYEEAASMGQWTVNLFRTLVNTNAAIYSPYLVHSLRLLARFNIKINENNKAKVAILEAISISRRIQSPFSEPEIQFQLGEALITLAFICDLMNDTEASLEAAKEGVLLYEDRLIKSYIPDNGVDPNLMVHPSQISWHWGLALFYFSDKAVCDYSRALEQLSFSLQRVDELEESFKAGVKALEVILYSRPEVRDNPDNQTYIASSLYRLSHQQFHTVTTLERALKYAEECIARYRPLYLADKDQHILSLCESLFEYANLLGKLERYDEALVIWKETAQLAEEIVDNQVLRADALNQLSWNYRKLERHSEAASIRSESVTVYQTSLDSTSDKAAHGYYNLGVDLRLAGRFAEAVEALNIALTKYRALAFNDPYYTKNIGNTLNQLILNLIHSNRHDEAFNDGYESLKLHKVLVEKDTTAVQEYRFAVLLNINLAEVAENETKCIERSRHNVVCARELAEQFPEEECRILLMQAILSRAVVLCRFERLSEGMTAIQESVDWFERHPFQSSKEAEQQMHTLITSCSISHNLGYSRVPLELLEKSIDIGKQFPSDQIIADTLVGSMQRRVEVIGFLGRYDDAKDACIECEEFARKLDHPTSIVNLISCLRTNSIAFRDVGATTKATAYIEEALQLCRTPQLEKAAMKRYFAPILESECMYTLSDCLADAGKNSEALELARQSVDAALALKGKYATLPWSEIEPSYIEALHTLAMRLAANNDLDKALEVTLEARIYYEKRAKLRNGNSLPLARSLRLESILYCKFGRHEEGMSAIAKLQVLQSRLDIALPELAERIRLQLLKDETYPSWIILLGKLDIRCEHHSRTTLKSR